MKFTHTIINNAITNPVIDFINNNFDSAEHRFYVIRGWDQGLIRTAAGNNILLINSIKNSYNGFRLLKDLLFSKKIFIHGLFTPYLVTMLFLMPFLLRKCHWLVWGGDLHFYDEPDLSFNKRIIEFMRSRVIRNMGHILTSIRGDYEIAKEKYNTHGKHKETCYPYYPSAQTTDLIDRIISDTGDKEKHDGKYLRVLIGNSASESNRHIEILGILSKFSSENIRIYASLAYGDMVYAQKVCDLGKSIFGEKFICMNEFLQYDEFVRFVNKIDILVFNHERQQGKGNLFLALYLGKKVYMNDKSSLWKYFTEDLKLQVELTKSIGNASFREFSATEGSVVDRNKTIIHDILRQDRIVDQWNELFC